MDHNHLAGFPNTKAADFTLPLPATEDLTPPLNHRGWGPFDPALASARAIAAETHAESFMNCDDRGYWYAFPVGTDGEDEAILEVFPDGNVLPYTVS